LVIGVRSALTAASAGLGDAAAEMIAAVPDALCWTNWQRLYSILLTACENQDSPDHICQLLGDICQLLELRGLKPYDSRPIASAQIRWEGAGIPDKIWSLPIAYHYRVTSSLAAGWERLLSLDVSPLHPLAWHLNVTASDYDFAAHLAHFQLESLSDLAWCPLNRFGGRNEHRR
jgi:hypothetical protein